MYCAYYQAQLVKETTWFVVGLLKAELNFVFDRAMDFSQPQLFEFFVPRENEEDFLKFMNLMVEKKCVLMFEKKANRLELKES